MLKSKQIGWLDRYADGGNISGPKVPPIKLNGTEVYEHGEDTATADHQENGVEPTDLTKKGVTYAKQIGEQAAKQGKKAIISSDIERAIQTAGIMANEAGIPHTTNPLLRTWDIGEYDGKPEGSFKEKQWVKIPNTPVPGGEPFNSFTQRMEQAYKMVKAAPKSDDIVTHSKVTRAFKALEATDGKWTNNTTKKFQSLKEETKAKDGLLLEKKADNYGKHGNYNDASVSTGPGFVGLGYNTKGRDYSPAWGGQFQHGGFLQPNSWKLPSAVAIPNRPDILSSELATSIGGENGEPAYLIPSFKGGKRVDALKEFIKTGEHLGGPFKTWQEADKWEQEVRHPYVEKGQSIPSPYKTWGEMQEGGSLPGAIGMMYARTQNPAPANGKYAKKTKASAQDGIFMETANFKGPGYQFNNQFDPTASPIVHPTLDIKDSRKIDKASGNKITDKNKLEYNVDTSLVKDIVGKAKHFGKDPYTALAMAYQESGIGNSEAGKENPFHISDSYDDDYNKLDTKYKGDQVSMFLDMLDTKLKFATRLGKKDDANQLQSWNGYGKITPKSEDNTNFYYGIDVNKHPINMNKNPVYGNRVVDVRDNIIKKDNNIRKIVENTSSFQNGGEMQFYQNGLDFVPKTISENGSVIKDDRGQWAHPGEITQINSNNITMQGVNYPVLGVSDTGDTKLMQPGKDYKFKGKKVIEYPQAQNGWLGKYEQQPGTLSQSDMEKRLALEKNIKDQKAVNAQPTISQYTPKLGDQERMNANRAAYLADEAKPLNRAASSKVAANAMNNIVEPMINIEMGMGAGKLAKPALEAVGKYLTEETALKNAYKINPWAFKPNSNNWYRRVGESGIEDALNTGIVKGKNEIIDNNSYDVFLNTLKTGDRTRAPYFSKGNVYMGDAYRKDGLLETNLPNDNFQSSYMFRLANETGPNNLGTAVLHPKQELRNLENFNVYKSDWLKGFKKIDKPTHTEQVISRGVENPTGISMDNIGYQEPATGELAPYIGREEWMPETPAEKIWSSFFKGKSGPIPPKKKNGGWLNKYK